MNMLLLLLVLLPSDTTSKNLTISYDADKHLPEYYLMGDYIFGGIFSIHSAFYGEGTFEKPPLFFNVIRKR